MICMYCNITGKQYDKYTKIQSIQHTIVCSFMILEKQESEKEIANITQNKEREWCNSSETLKKLSFRD